MNKLEVGSVVEVSGNSVIIQMRETSNPPFYYFNNVFYQGVSVGSFLGVMSGPYKIVLRIEKEYIEDLFRDFSSQEYNKDRYVRKVVAKVVGSFLGDKIRYGMSQFPFIHNIAVLLSDKEIESILTGSEKDRSDTKFRLGESLEAKIPIHIYWDELFNTHLGIFGNTGSGKSNTLACLFTRLFDEGKTKVNLSNSQFLFIDFSGEYSHPNLLSTNKKILKLSTSGDGDKISISERVFWNDEVLSILFSATEKTQKPFLHSVIQHYFQNGSTQNIGQEDILDWIIRGFEVTFNANNNKESMQLLRLIIESSINFRNDISLPKFITDSTWHSSSNTYYHPCKDGKGSEYWNNHDCQDQLSNFILELRTSLENSISDDLTVCEQILLASRLELLNRLARNDVQFDHIHPLINRIRNRRNIIDNLFNIGDKEENNERILVVSLRDCNIEAKKVVPLLLAIQSYNDHKRSLGDSVSSTFHLIIDEAHNILSTQSNRETETWKDYRLEVFEEIIKEGRKFGFFLTIASQRPSDISSTIVSQIHNFFIHRLVNENDLYMMTSTVSSLDSVTKQKIPSLGPGQCIILGTSFKFPLLVQIDFLDDRAPKSETIDLMSLWENIPF